MFIAIFTTARHLSIFWDTWIHSTPFHRVSLRPILILSSHLPLGLSTYFVNINNITVIQKGWILVVLLCHLCAHVTASVDILQTYMWNVRYMGTRLHHVNLTLRSRAECDLCATGIWQSVSKLIAALSTDRDVVCGAALRYESCVTFCEALPKSSAVVFNLGYAYPRGYARIS